MDPHSKTIPDWRLYLEQQYKVSFDQKAAELVRAAVLSVASQPYSSKGDFQTINTKDFLLPLASKGFPLDGLRLANHVGGAIGQPPWHEPQADPDTLLSNYSVYGSTRPSVEFHSCIETAAGLATTTPGFESVTPWHLAFSILTSNAAGITWQLQSMNSSADDAAEVFLSNMEKAEPDLFKSSDWRSHFKLQEKGSPGRDTAGMDRKSALDSIESHWERFKSSHRLAPGFELGATRTHDVQKWIIQEAPPFGSSKSHVSLSSIPFRISEEVVILGLLLTAAEVKKGNRSLAPAQTLDWAKRVVESANLDSTQLKAQIQRALFRAQTTENNSTRFGLIPEALANLFIQAEQLSKQISDGVIDERHFVAVYFRFLIRNANLHIPKADFPDTSLLLESLSAHIESNTDIRQRDNMEEWTKLLSEIRDALEARSDRMENSSLAPAEGTEQQNTEFEEGTEERVSQPLAQSHPDESEPIRRPDLEGQQRFDEQSEDDVIPDTDARRGPRSFSSQHRDLSVPFRRLMLEERTTRSKFIQSANLILSSACSNTLTIAWEDVAAIGDADRSPEVTAGSIYIAFLETGLSERHKADEDSLPADLVRRSEVSPDRLNRFRFLAIQATPTKSSITSVSPSETQFQLWTEATRIANQCSEDKLIAARHLLAAFILLYERNQKIHSELERLEFDPDLALRILIDHLRIYETTTHQGWRNFFQSIQHDGFSVLANFGQGITPTRYNSLCLDIDSTAKSIAKLFNSSRLQQSESTGSSAKPLKITDFVFALYGEWGRGKSTLMEKVAEILCDHPNSFLENADAPEAKSGFCLKTRKRLHNLGDGIKNIIWGHPKVAPCYESLEFSAWKYPSRPEVWVHLYEKIRETAEHKSTLQRMRISFRIGLLESGWWPLIIGFLLLFIARLPIFEWAGYFWQAVGWVGALIVAGFFLRMSRIGLLVGRHYITVPDHADKLGLQAVVGRDLKNLLRTWLVPAHSKAADPDLACIDFRCFKTGWWFSFFIFLLFTVSLLLACRSISEAHESRKTEISLAIAEASQVKTSHELLMTIPINDATAIIKADLPEFLFMQKKEIPKLSNPIGIYWFLGVVGFAGLLYGWIVTRPVKRYQTLLLTIDDLDRCDTEQMLAVIESLRLFLDDPAMSGRLQMAMLMDLRILNDALACRARKKGLKRDDSEIRNLQRSHREKIFLCELAMPPLHDKDCQELLDSLFPAHVIQAPNPLPTSVETKSNEPVKAPNEEGQPVLTGEVPLGETVDSPQIPRADSPPHIATDQSPPTSAPKTISESESTVEILGDGERNALVYAISQIPSNQLTPRTLLMIKVRFELVRLLLQQQGKNEQLSEAILGGIAAKLVENVVPGLGLYSAPLDPAIERIVSQVTCD